LSAADHASRQWDREARHKSSASRVTLVALVVYADDELF
jgi:hypothetical protein